MPLNLTTRRNAESATTAVDRLDDLELHSPRPYPGSDVLWEELACGRTGCDWTGALFYSHLRASRGHNRRHVGCTGTPGTYRVHRPDSEITHRLAEAFPGIDFTLSTGPDGRTITWTGGPEPLHVTARLGTHQGTCNRLP
ncbi:hypothetical protein F4556_005106 [Kitasatospora gansuensis]|uniref:Uncharacterized protein n=1 Tax=Kitasatospora gansuensis TaxID=258050 RepID=A0A7W7SHT8_9ACTN|nr:hypothetical protein [Kitasatospora gansuensis]MBB4949571.1 hypothetical protein [Kitasatospora gansuensis]